MRFEPNKEHMSTLAVNNAPTCSVLWVFSGVVVLPSIIDNRIDQVWVVAAQVEVPYPSVAVGRFEVYTGFLNLQRYIRECIFVSVYNESIRRPLWASRIDRRVFLYHDRAVMSVPLRDGHTMSRNVHWLHKEQKKNGEKKILASNAIEIVVFFLLLGNTDRFCFYREQESVERDRPSRWQKLRRLG